MEIEKEFKNSNLIKKTIIYPAYQTTHRFHNLYSDVRTFVRELIQNADDADAESIQFNINLPKEIEVINDGRPFDSDDIERLLTPCLGGKDFEKTGAMNLGALSVLSVSDEPWYHSGNTLLKFEMDHESEDFIPYINETYESNFDGTRLVLPLHSRLSSDDLKKLDKIDEFLTRYSHLLFTRSIKQLILNYPNKKFELIKNIENETVLKRRKFDVALYNITITETFTKRKGSDIRINNWFVAKRDVIIPKEYFSPKELELYGEIISLPIYIAFYIENDFPKRINYPIYIVYPSETFLGLGLVLSSNFKPETSRKGFSTEGNDGKLNIFLLKKASELLEVVLSYLKDEISKLSPPKRVEYFNKFLATLYYRETYSSLESYIKDYINEKIIEFLENNVLDSDGNWAKASRIAISNPGLWPFFSNKYRFIEPPVNESIKDLLKSAGVKELKIDDLIIKLSSGEITNIDKLLDAWLYLSLHKSDINNNLYYQLLNNRTLPNRLGKLTDPNIIRIPDKEAVELYSPNKSLHPSFVKNNNIKTFIQNLGIKSLNKKEVLEYFLLIKSRFSTKNFDVVKDYYEYFYKYGLFDKRRRIVLTNQGYKNPEEVFFNRVAITSVLGKEIPLIPRKLESSRICKMYLVNLGVSKDLTTKYVMKYIRKYGTNVISIDILKFLSKNVRKLTNREIKELSNMELIPTTDNEFVKPNECYLLTPQIKKLLGNLVNYFDPKDEKNKEWIRFFKKIGVSKNPKIEHLQLALKDSLKAYQAIGIPDPPEITEAILERIELIFQSIGENKERDSKKKLIVELKRIKSIPSTMGILKPSDIYSRKDKIYLLLGDSVPYPLIKIPYNLIEKLQLKEDAEPTDVAEYLFKKLLKKNFLKENDKTKKETTQLFDRIYSFLGQSDHFSKLQNGIKRKFYSEPIIYLPTSNKFEKASSLVIHSREAEMIYGSKKYMIKYSDYPNSLNFFKKIGVKTSINTDDIADFLVEYCSSGDIDTRRLFMLYNSIGNRFSYLSHKKRAMLMNAKIILTDDLKSFEYPDKIFIPDEKSYLEKFKSIKTAVINDKILTFLEQVGVKKISEVIEKSIVFSGGQYENDFSKDLPIKMKELTSFVDAIAKESNINLDREWKRRILRTKFIICERIDYELRYKNERHKIQGKLAEYTKKNNTIGIKEGNYTRNPIKFLMDLSKAISSILFIKDVSKAKLMSPLIEKLLQSEDKIQTLKELGFSTFKLEAKQFDIPTLKLNLPKIPTQYQSLTNQINEIYNKSKRYKFSSTRLNKKDSRNSRKPKKFNIVEDHHHNQQLSRMGVNPNINSSEHVNIILKSPPNQNQLIKQVKNELSRTFDGGNYSNQYNIDSRIKRTMKTINKKIYKSMEFPGRAQYGGNLDITPPIPKLRLEKTNGLHFYVQENLQMPTNLRVIKKFHEILRFIIEMMEGNPETVSVALFEAPVNAFNYDGQLVFNYLTMAEASKDIPIFLIWIFIAAHELAHNISHNHDQLHSKYMTIFAIRGIQKLHAITDKYTEIFNKN